MKITAEFNSNEEMLEFISTFGAKNWAESDNTKIAIKEETKTKKATTKKGEVSKEEPKTEPKEEKPKENVETKTAGVDEAPTTDPIDEKTYTKKEVQDICKNKIKEGKQLEVKAIIAKHGAKNISSIAQEEYAAVIAEVEVL